jgi:hypothetical protein
MFTKCWSGQPEQRWHMCGVHHQLFTLSNQEIDEGGRGGLRASQTLTRIEGSIPLSATQTVAPSVEIVEEPLPPICQSESRESVDGNCDNWLITKTLTVMILSDSHSTKLPNTSTSFNPQTNTGGRVP